MSVQRSPQVEPRIPYSSEELEQLNYDSLEEVIHWVDRGEECPFCSRDIGDDRYNFSLYPEPPLDIVIPGTPAPHVYLCEDCGDRVLDLAHTWRRTPPSEFQVPVYRMYTEPVDDCCFCERSLQRPALGISISLNAHEQPKDFGASYTLCTKCARIFERFLNQLAEEVDSS